VGQDQDQRGIAQFDGALDSDRRRRRKFHMETARPQITAELLTKQRLHIRFVIDDENVSAQCVPPVLPCAARVRGSVMMNSVNAPGSVFTSILPPCCFTTMS